MYLVDTHTLLWSLFEPEKLPSRHQAILQNVNEQKLISTLSVWEVSLKFGLGRLDLGGHTPEMFLEKARSFGFQIIAPKPATFASFYRLNLLRDHKDPFDRMLIWHAVCAQLTLISSDAHMARYQTLGLSLF